MDMQVSMTSALYLVGFSQGIYLLLTPHVHRGRSLLLLFLGAMTLLMANYFVWENDWLSTTTQFWVNRFTHASLPYVLGPSLYLYMRLQATESFELKVSHLWHGVPYGVGLVTAVWLIPQYLPLSRVYTQNWLFPSASWPQLLRGIHVLIYVVLGVRLALVQFWTLRWPLQVDAYRNVLTVAILIMASCSMVVSTYTYLLTDMHTWKLYWQQVAVVCAVCMVYLMNQLITQHHLSRLILSPAGVTQSLDTSIELPSKYKNSTIDQVSAILLFEQLEAYLSTTHAFKDSDLSMPQLAQSLSVSPNQLSQVINQIGGLSFYDLLSRYRVEAACALLTDSSQQHFSVLGIGYEVGFQSKSTYYAAFRRVCGMTPNAYRKQGGQCNQIDTV